ncbi:unnamed protein product [Leuciscus chuanchicus]
MEIKKLKASRNGAWMDQNALDRVLQLLYSPLINADIADGLQPAGGGKEKAEGKAEKGKAEEGKAEEGKAEEGKAEKGKAEEGKAEKGKVEGDAEKGKVEGDAEVGKAEGKGEAEEGEAEEGDAEGKVEEGKGKAEEGEAEVGKVEGKAEEGEAPQPERSERLKEFMIEYCEVLERFSAQVSDTSPYEKLREIQAIKLQIEEETKDIRPSPDAPIG